MFSVCRALGKICQEMDQVIEKLVPKILPPTYKATPSIYQTASGYFWIQFFNYFLIWFLVFRSVVGRYGEILFFLQYDVLSLPLYYLCLSLAYQRMSWEALKKSINGLVNKVR